MVRGILVKDGTIKEVLLDGTLDTYYSVLHCRTIDIISCRIGGNRYDVICDDEGLFNPDAPITIVDVDTMHPILVGNIFICRHDGDGNEVDLTDRDISIILSAWRHKVLLVRS